MAAPQTIIVKEKAGCFNGCIGLAILIVGLPIAALAFVYYVGKTNPQPTPSASVAD